MRADRDRLVDWGRDDDRVVCEVRTSRFRLAVVVRLMTDRGPREVDVVGRAFRISMDRRRPVRPRATAAIRVAAAGGKRWP
jgi:hypothetical protein